MGRTRRTATLVLSLALAQCSARRQTSATSTTLSPPAPGVVVARIGGEPVTVSELQDFARSQAISDPRRALERYIDQRLLARHAIARGHLEDPLVRDVARRAEVQAVLERAVEARVTEANVPAPALEFARRTRGFALAHGPLFYVWHALVVRERSGPTPSTPESRRARAEAIRAALVAQPQPLTFERIRATAESVSGAGGLHVEPVTGFDSGGITGRPETVDRTFASAAAAIEQPGGVSPVIETPFGFHVIVLDRREPGITADPAMVEREVTREALTLARSRALQSLLGELRSRYRVRFVDATEGRP